MGRAYVFPRFMRKVVFFLKLWCVYRKMESFNIFKRKWIHPHVFSAGVYVTDVEKAAHRSQILERACGWVNSELLLGSQGT